MPADDRYAEYVAKIAAAWPPLSEQQLDRIAALLNLVQPARREADAEG